MSAEKSISKNQHYLLKHKSKDLYVNTIDLDEKQLHVEELPFISNSESIQRIHTHILKWDEIFELSSNRHYNPKEFEIKLVELNWRRQDSTHDNMRYLFKHKAKDLFIQSNGLMDLHISEHPIIINLKDANHINSMILRKEKILNELRTKNYNPSDFEMKSVELFII